MTVRVKNRRKRTKANRQLWRHLRAAMRLLLKHPIPSVTVVPRLPNGRIVLVRRVDSDQWVLPGGVLEWGETVQEAAAREVEEEAGVEVVGEVRLIGVYSAPERDPRTHAISILVEAAVEGTPGVHDPLEVSEVRTFAPERAPVQHMGLGTGAMLRDALEGRIVVA